LAALREQIERAIPLSAGRYNNKVVATAAPRIAELEERRPCEPSSSPRATRRTGGSSSVRSSPRPSASISAAA
ncbi:hypothetical protein CTI14_51305, partial [Methylobacterium radiotolerans]